MDAVDLISAQEMSRQCRCLAAQRQARKLARTYDAALKPVQLTSGQFSILASLNQPEPVPLTRLADILGLERTTLTRNLGALERGGFVASRADESDRRVRQLALTVSGRAKLAAAMPLWRAAQGAAQSR